MATNKKPDQDMVGLEWIAPHRHICTNPEHLSLCHKCNTFHHYGIIHRCNLSTIEVEQCDEVLRWQKERNNDYQDL